MRGLDPVLHAGLQASVIAPVFFAMLTFRSGVEYVSTAGFPITWNGHVFRGMGVFGEVSAFTEGTEVRADGITLTLSGIDPALMEESLADIQPLAPAKVWFGLLNGAQLVGAPYCIFAGVVDKPTITIAADTATISLALETRMSNLNRANQRRLTSADQNANGYPDDSGLDWVEKTNDINLRWGN